LICTAGGGNIKYGKYKEDAMVKRALVLAVAAVFAAGTLAFAQGGRPEYKAGKKEAKGEMKAFRHQQKAETKAFRHQQKAENKAFKESLAGKTGQERSDAIVEHKNAQKAENREFRAQQKSENKAEKDRIKSELDARKAAATAAK
jgi:hypothetical protein